MNTKARKVLARIGLVLLGVIVAALGVRAVFNYTTGRKLEAYLEDARAKGIPVSLKDITPRCDDLDNGARFWNAAEALFVIPEGKDKGQTYKTLINSTIIDLFRSRPLNEESRKKLADLIALNRRSLDLLLEAGGRPCISQGDWASLSPDMEVSRLVRTMQAMRLIGIDAVLQADSGEVKRGLDECRQGMVFIRKTLDESFLINGLMAVSNMKKSPCLFQQDHPESQAEFGSSLGLGKGDGPGSLAGKILPLRSNRKSPQYGERPAGSKGGRRSVAGGRVSGLLT